MTLNDRNMLAGDACVWANLCDVSLVSLARDGDGEAYSELYRRHATMATRAIRRITRNHEDTEDVLQETFIRALVHLKSFDGRAAFSTWLTRIAVNSALMLLRKKRRRSELSADGDFDESNCPVFQLEDPALDPEDLCCKHEEAMRVRQAVGRLPPLLRNVTTIRYAEDVSVKEAAEILGISVSAAKSRLLRANLELHSILQSSGLRATPRAPMRQGYSSLSSSSA